MELFYKELILMPLPKLNNLVRIYMIEFQNDGSNFIMTSYLKHAFTACDLRMKYDYSVGEGVIINFQNITLTHVTQFSPMRIKNLSDIFQKAYSDRLMSFDFINVPSFATTVIHVFMTVLPAKLSSKIRVHKLGTDLLQFYSSEVLPNELGGTAGPLNELHDEWLKFLKSQNDWIKEAGLRRSDESKRIGEPLDSDMFGMSGTFRKLNVD